MKSALLVIRESDSYRSQGLRNAHDQAELVVPFSRRDNAEAAREMCEVLIRYIQESDRKILPGEKMGWATSMIQFNEEGKYLVACGLDNKDTFSRGVDDILIRWKAQRRFCDENKSEYVATALIDRAVVSPDLLDGSGSQVIHGVRYPFKAPNCGWWLFGERYAGEISSMKTAHVGHVVTANPEIVPYLSLGPGFTFEPGKGVWFQDDVASAEPI